jgi:hypothetical protein
MVDAQYPTTYTDSSTFWSIIIAEQLDSDGGSAGDASTVNITSLTPANNFVFLRTPKFKHKKTSKDAVASIPGNFHTATIIGTIDKKLTLKKCFIIDRSVAEMNALDAQLETWMEEGNSRAGVNSLYLAVKLQESGSDAYLTFTVDGERQNWARVMIRDVDSEITPQMFTVNLKLEYAEN